ncbi:MAG: hypothetical protein U0894_05440 [Pirellulales bacterium]
MCKTRDELKARKEQLADWMPSPRQRSRLYCLKSGKKLRALSALQAVVEPLAGQLQASTKVRDFSTEDFEKELVRALGCCKKEDGTPQFAARWYDRSNASNAQYSAEEARPAAHWVIVKRC